MILIHFEECDIIIELRMEEIGEDGSLIKSLALTWETASHFLFPIDSQC